MKAKKMLLTLFAYVVVGSFLVIPAFTATRQITISGIGSSCYAVSPTTFSVSAGETVTVSWTGGKKFNMFLLNQATGMVTTFESSTSSISYTGRNAGNYEVHVQDGTNCTGTYSQKFTITDSEVILIQPKVKRKKLKKKY
jgi:plastocyanin